MIEINVQNKHWPCFQSLCQFRFSKHLLATSKSWTEQSWEFPEQRCPRLKTIHVCLCFQKVFYFVFKYYSCLFYVSINCFENNNIMIKNNFISRYHWVKRNSEKVLKFFFSHVFGKNKMLTVTGSLTKLKNEQKLLILCNFIRSDRHTIGWNETHKKWKKHTF